MKAFRISETLYRILSYLVGNTYNSIRIQGGHRQLDERPGERVLYKVNGMYCIAMSFGIVTVRKGEGRVPQWV